MFSIEEENRKKWNHIFKSNCLQPCNRSCRHREKSIASTPESASAVYSSNWIYPKRKPNSFSLTASRRIFLQPWMEVNGSVSFRPWVGDNQVHYFRLIEGVVSYEHRLWPEKRPVWSRKKLMNVEHRTSNVEWMHSVCFKKDFAKRSHPSTFDIRYSIFDSAESFDPESFSPVLTTEGLVAGCGSLFSPTAGRQSGQSNNEGTMPFWCSFIRA